MVRGEGTPRVYTEGKEAPGIPKKHSLSLLIVQAILAEDSDEQTCQEYRPISSKKRKRL